MPDRYLFALGASSVLVGGLMVWLAFWDGVWGGGRAARSGAKQQSGAEGGRQ